jgi:hypothetical protein
MNPRETFSADMLIAIQMKFSSDSKPFPGGTV